MRPLLLLHAHNTLSSHPPTHTHTYIHVQGQLEWAVQWGGDQEDLAGDIVLDPSGSFAYVTGAFQSAKFKLDAMNVLTPEGVTEESDDDWGGGWDDDGG